MIITLLYLPKNIKHQTTKSIILLNVWKCREWKYTAFHYNLTSCLGKRYVDTDDRTGMFYSNFPVQTIKNENSNFPHKTRHDCRSTLNVCGKYTNFSRIFVFVHWEESKKCIFKLVLGAVLAVAFSIIQLTFFLCVNRLQIQRKSKEKKTVKNY